jgi:hypothetical protein
MSKEEEAEEYNKRKKKRNRKKKSIWGMGGFKHRLDSKTNWSFHDFLVWLIESRELYTLQKTQPFWSLLRFCWLD